MKTRVVFCTLLVAVAAASGGCSQQTELQTAAAIVEDRLAWVEVAEPAAMFNADARGDQLHFLSVCGYSCIVPEVGSITAERCYPAVPVQVVEGTSDTRLSERHSSLVRRASEVAAEYNRLAAQALAKQGRSLCPDGANWDAALQDLQALVHTARPSLSERDLSVSATEPAFRLVLPRHLLNPMFESSACAILRKNKLPTTARIAVLGQQGAPETQALVLCGEASAA